MDKIDAGLHRAARAFALIGGAVLIGVMAMTVISIVGRALIPLGLRPVPGDFELVEHGVAFAAFCFLPLCQAARAHVSVDLLSGWFPSRVDAAFMALFDFAMAVLATFMLWRMWLGLADRQRYNDTTFILELPVAWGYAAALPSLALFAAIAAWMAWKSARRVVQP